MATDNSLFPDVAERYDRQPRAEDAAPQGEPVAQPMAPAGAVDPGRPAAPLPDEFDQAPAWLAVPDPAPQPVPTPRNRMPLLFAAVGVALVVLAGCACAFVLRGGTDGIAGTAMVRAAEMQEPAQTSTAAPPVQSPSVEAAWCADSVGGGRSVGSGPGSTSDGPGVIRAFDHAYYAERDGARVASLMVAPNPVPEIQRWIDDVPAGTRHCVTITATPDPNAYAVDLGLRMPGAPEGVIRQRVTVAPTPAGYRIAKVEDAQ